MISFIFVGEKRSPTAIRRGWTWQSGHLAARTLFAALEAAGIEPREQRYCNAWDDAGQPNQQELYALWLAAVRPDCIEVVVALGEKASRALEKAAVPHRKMIHPAARGSIRLRERYHAHVRDVLLNQHSEAIS